MQKISKKDQTPESIAAEQEATLNWMDKAKSEHFAPGTFVMWAGRRWRVQYVGGPVMMVVNPDDWTDAHIIYPKALDTRRYL